MSDIYDWATCDHRGIGQIGCPTCDADPARVRIRREREEVQRLRAEVERLRGLIRDAEFAAGGYIMGNPCCPWCEGLVGKTHRDDCPAFSARGEVRR